MKEVKGYTIIEENVLADLKSTSYICKHNKTGANIVLLENEDENKVFYIGFRTTPKESTGVSHIIEHSVLCGSKEFPVKDPFIELAKGSLNTFLNAMTYPDKTVYPVASCNDLDFQNLMHVYLDAVFYPNIYNNDLTFKQEGWHYELESLEDDLTVNGVVYNEMKGAFSSADDVLEREIFNSLFPDTAYSEESGGDPERIPDLTYEHFLEMHQTYYHPSNSYIYLYGNMDMEEKLRFIDETYLSKFDALVVDSTVEKQKPFLEKQYIEKQYSISEGETKEDNTYLSYNVVVSDALEKEKYIAFQVLDYALCSAPGAPIKQALLDEKIGKKVYSFFDNGILQPYFSIIAKQSNKEEAKNFEKIIEKELAEIVQNGLNKKSLIAALNGLEFKYREADFGSYPPGLMYGLQMLDSWIYDETQPFLHVIANETFEFLREKINTNYFEQLIEECILNNSHKSLLVVTPEVNLVSVKEKELAEKLEEYKASLSKVELEKIVKETKELEAYQEEENTEEEKACIPVLNREDIKKEAEPYIFEEHFVNQNLCLYHNVYTNGIAYTKFLFDVSKVSEELFPYIGILKMLLRYMNTTKHSYLELSNEIYTKTGGIVSSVTTYTNSKNIDESTIYFEWKAKVLERNLEDVFLLLEEIIKETKFDDDKRLYEIIASEKSSMQSTLLSSSHRVAAMRATSYFSKSAAIGELIGGIPFYRFLEDLERNFEEKKEDLKVKIHEVCSLIFQKANVMYDFTGSKECLTIFKERLQVWNAFYQDTESTSIFDIKVENKKEGFLTSSQVQYVAKAGNFKKYGLEYTGHLKVLKVILGYDYLWNQVRVKGGAYGCMSHIGTNGDIFFVSYRDPNLAKTLVVYDAIPEFIEEYIADERSVTQSIIGTISDLDTPLTPSAKGSRALTAYLTKYTIEDAQKERNEILSITVSDIRKLADHIRKILAEDAVCVVGNEGIIKENKELFLRLEHLIQDI
ncbi:MAG: insulinase family protein [Lachnospiraceae bacterium]